MRACRNEVKVRRFKFSLGSLNIDPSDTAKHGIQYVLEDHFRDVIFWPIWQEIRRGIELSWRGPL